MRGYGNCPGHTTQCHLFLQEACPDFSHPCSSLGALQASLCCCGSSLHRPRAWEPPEGRALPPPLNAPQAPISSKSHGVVRHFCANEASSWLGALWADQVEHGGLLLSRQGSQVTQCPPWIPEPASQPHGAPSVSPGPKATEPHCGGAPSSASRGLSLLCLGRPPRLACRHLLEVCLLIQHPRPTLDQAQ